VPVGGLTPTPPKNKAEIEDMVHAGRIVPSKSCWVAPIVLVDKPDGTVRFCMNDHKLNSVTKPDAYPMPRLDYLIET
ncbi:hypothetical protein JRQ81_018249, partial [Phrynocephalus forsythii]